VYNYAVVGNTATSGKLSDKGKYPNVYRATTPDPLKLQTLMHFIREEFQVTVAAVLHIPSDYATGMAGDAVEYGTNEGMAMHRFEIGKLDENIALIDDEAGWNATLERLERVLRFVVFGRSLLIRHCCLVYKARIFTEKRFSVERCAFAVPFATEEDDAVCEKNINECKCNVYVIMQSIFRQTPGRWFFAR